MGGSYKPKKPYTTRKRKADDFAPLTGVFVKKGNIVYYDGPGGDNWSIPIKGISSDGLSYLIDDSIYAKKKK